MFYIQLDTDIITDIITDIVDYPVVGYIPVDIPTPFPEGINARWYRWTGTEAVLDATLKSADVSTMIDAAVSKVVAEKEAMQAELAILKTVAEVM
jgi:hypothetical protein